MLRAAVTVACAVALAVAAASAYRCRDQRRVPSPLTGDEPLGERVSVTVGRIGGMLAGASVAGVLTVGAGIRLMMRLLAVTSSDDVQGRRTEADAVIGEVTASGSVFLVVVVGLVAGLAGLALYALVRRWLPERSMAAGLVGAAIGAGLLVRPVGLISAANRDFTIVAPAALAVALALVTLVLFGATFGVLVDRFAGRWPRPSRSVRGVAGLAPFAVLVAAPAALLGVAAAAVIGTVAPTLRSRSAPTEAAAAVRGGRRPGATVLLGLGGLGGVSVLVAALQVLAL